MSTLNSMKTLKTEITRYRQGALYLVENVQKYVTAAYMSREIDAHSEKIFICIIK